MAGTVHWLLIHGNKCFCQVKWGFLFSEIIIYSVINLNVMHERTLLFANLIGPPELKV